MLNCAGGVLLIGVGDDGVVRGLYATAPGVLVARATRTIERDVWPRPAGLLRVEAPPLSSGWGGQRRYLVRVVVRDLRTCGGGRCYYAISDAAGNHAAGWSFGGKWWVPYVRQQASTCALEPRQVKALEDDGRDVVWKTDRAGPNGDDAEWTFGAEDEAYAAEQVAAVPAAEEAEAGTAERPPLAAATAAADLPPADRERKGARGGKGQVPNGCKGCKGWQGKGWQGKGWQGKGWQGKGERWLLKCAKGLCCWSACRAHRPRAK